MATDVEESDTDDHERPAPPKRQCTRLVNTSEPYESLNERLGESDRRTEEAEKCEYDEVERLAREKLSIWQECQVAKGFLDNTINCVVEDYILNPPVTYSTDDSEFRLFRGSEMEDTAVMMAIRNHGLVHNDVPVTQSTTLCVDRISGQRHWTSSEIDENADLLRSFATTNRLPDVENLSSTVPLASSSSIFDPTARSIREIDRRVGTSWNEDKMDESEQDFLERAVAEAIKKKGLSALSVDYG